MAKEINYEQALKQLETIVRRMENDELNIDELAGELAKAQKLVSLCNERLGKAEKEVNKLLQSEE